MRRYRLWSGALLTVQPDRRCFLQSSWCDSETEVPRSVAAHALRVHQVERES